MAPVMSARRTSVTGNKITLALMKKMEDMRGADGAVKYPSLNKVLLKFEKIERVLLKVHEIFDSFDVDQSGGIDLNELATAMVKMGHECTEQEVQELFDQANVDGKAEKGSGQQVLDKREFMLCLAIGHVIGIIPQIASADSRAAVAEPATVKSVDPADKHLGDDVLEGSSREIHDVMQLIVETYLIFDPSGSGIIQKSDLPKTCDKLGKKGEGGRNPLLSEDRWKEMDWDKNNCITFEEFVFSFHTWVMLENDGGD